MMRRSCKNARVRLTCENIKALVNLKGIGIDDFRPEPNGDIGGKFGLTACGWAYDIEGAEHGLIVGRFWKTAHRHVGCHAGAIVEFHFGPVAVSS
jgi:hypothetical protein